MHPTDPRPSHPVHHISFSLQPKLIGAEDLRSDGPSEISAAPEDQFVQVDAQLELDGRIVEGAIRGLPLDFMAVLAQGARPGLFMPFNCSCGVSECEGIFDYSVLKVEGNEVHWYLPRQPFARRFPAEHVPPTGPLYFRFNLREYQQMLFGLTKQLSAIEREFGKAVYPNVDIPFAGHVSPPGKLLSRIRRERRHHDEWIARASRTGCV